jgi:hypothetical protein
MQKTGRSTACVLCKSSRYAKNPLWLLAAHLHRSLAQAPKACTRNRFCITLHASFTHGRAAGRLTNATPLFRL